MASLAVFRTLYDEEKDLFSVIASFSKLLIFTKKLKCFELQRFCLKFKEEYGFDLPTAVIKTSLKRLKFLEVKQSFYTLKGNVEELDTNKISKLEDENNQKNRTIIELLVSYVENEENAILNEEQRQILCSSFCSFVIDENTDVQYKDYISSFVLKNSSDSDFINQLNNIRIGLVVFIGLSYNANFDTVDGIDTKLNIYLDTEILFHRAGYNGKLYKKVYDEFYNLVQEINGKARKTLISLYYFAETEKEVRDYFAIAEEIVRGRKRVDPSKTAMQYIVTNTQSASDVKSMETTFFHDLQIGGIALDRQENYYDRQHYELNIEQSDFVISDSFTEEDVGRKLKLLNYVNIKRGKKAQNVFRNIGHILLTGNSLTFKISLDERIKKKGDIPLATGLDFLTNRFWLIANKGFTKKLQLTSLNILTKAQFVMSSSVNGAISARFKALVKEEKEGCFDLEKQKITLAGLHKHSIKPEDLTSVNQETYLNFIKMEDVSAYIAEQELLRQRGVAANKLANKAVEVLMKQENSKRQEEYKREKEKYDEHKRRWVKGKMFKKKWYSICWVSSYVFLIILLCVLSLIKLNGWWAAIAAILSAVIPCIRPLCNHHKILDSFRFLCSRKIRCEEKENLEQKYNDEEETCPQLKSITKEEIEAKLIGDE